MIVFVKSDELSTGTGVVTGLTAGKLCTDPRRYPIFIKSMFVIASIGLVATVVTTFIQEELYPSTLYTLLIVEMMVCGSTTLGFIGIGLAAVVETTHPVSSELSGGTVELFVQVSCTNAIYQSRGMYINLNSPEDLRAGVRRGVRGRRRAAGRAGFHGKRDIVSRSNALGSTTA